MNGSGLSRFEIYLQILCVKDSWKKVNRCKKSEARQELERLSCSSNEAKCTVSFLCQPLKCFLWSPAASSLQQDARAYNVLTNRSFITHLRARVLPSPSLKWKYQQQSMAWITGRGEDGHCRHRMQNRACIGHAMWSYLWIIGLFSFFLVLLLDCNSLPTLC